MEKLDLLHFFQFIKVTVKMNQRKVRTFLLFKFKMFFKFALCVVQTIYTYFVMNITAWVNSITLFSIFKWFIIKVRAYW